MASHRGAAHSRRRGRLEVAARIEPRAAAVLASGRAAPRWLAVYVAALGEEAWLAAMIEVMMFSRQSNESIDALLSQFLTLRHRAHQQHGSMTVS